MKKEGFLFMLLAVFISCGPVIEQNRPYSSEVRLDVPFEPNLEGVQKPLSAVLKDFQFILLKNCGHMPWIERQARDEFYRILEAELR